MQYTKCVPAMMLVWTNLLHHQSQSKTWQWSWTTFLLLYNSVNKHSHDNFVVSGRVKFCPWVFYWAVYHCYWVQLEELQEIARKIKHEHTSMSHLHRPESVGTWTHIPSQNPQSMWCVSFHKAVQLPDKFSTYHFNEGLNTAFHVSRELSFPCHAFLVLLHHNFCYHICITTSVSWD